MIDTSLFPYSNFPIRLQFGDKKDFTIAWFECTEHLDKYLERYKLDKRKVKIDYRDGEPTKSNKKLKDNVQQRTRKTSSGSTSRSKGSTKKLDSAGTTSHTRKSKPKSK